MPTINIIYGDSEKIPNANVSISQKVQIFMYELFLNYFADSLLEECKSHAICILLDEMMEHLSQCLKYYFLKLPTMRIKGCNVA